MPTRAEIAAAIEACVRETFDGQTATVALGGWDTVDELDCQLRDLCGDVFCSPPVPIIRDVLDEIKGVNWTVTGPISLEGGQQAFELTPVICWE